MKRNLTPSLYILNDEEQIYLRYAPSTLTAKKILLSDNVWVAMIQLSLQKSVNNVGQDCNHNKNYNRTGKNIISLVCFYMDGLGSFLFFSLPVLTYLTYRSLLTYLRMYSFMVTFNQA